jgi:hypothetical protein
METWYKTSYYDEIKPVEVEKHTDSSVWVKGKRLSRTTEWSCYFDNFQDAKDHLVRKCRSKIEHHRQQALNYGKYWNNVLKIEEPK